MYLSVFLSVFFSIFSVFVSVFFFSSSLQRALKAFAGNGRVLFLETLVVGQLVVVLKQPVQVLKISRVLSIDGGGGAEGKGVHAERPTINQPLRLPSPEKCALAVRDLLFPEQSLPPP